MLRVALCLVLLAGVHAALPCPKGLKCLAQQSRPTAQATGNKGTQCYLPDPDVIPQIQLYADQGLYPSMIGHTIVPLLKLDITLQIRYFLLTTLASWNAITPWHPTAINSDFAPGFGLPFKKFTVTNETEAKRSRNIALAFAYHRVNEVIMPFAGVKSGEVVAAAGFDPNYKGYSDLSKPQDIGNAAGFAVLKFWESDGYNQDGMGSYSKTAYGRVTPTFGSALFPANYSDWTNYEPLNDGWTIRDMTKWQPLVEHNGLGYFYQQRHITPQAGWARPWAITRKQIEQNFTIPAPWPAVMDDAALADYKAEADAVLNASASLTDYQKIAVEHFDVKPLSFGAILYGIYLNKYDWDLTTSLAYDLNLPMFHDATIVAWRNKIIHQGVRPVSAIRYLYGNTNVTAYRGPAKGVGPIPGRKFSSYMRTMPHTDFPSGTACLCSAFAEFNARFIGSNTFDYSIRYNAGCSTREPGITPKAAFTLALKTKADFVRVCSQSRLWGGVHFPKSIDAAVKLCAPIGVIGYAKAARMLHGK